MRNQTMHRLVRACGILLAIGVCSASLPGLAGAQDVDGDGVLDAVDNCPFVPNGPNELSNQANDLIPVDPSIGPDAFGNACDTDYTGDGFTGAVDLAFLVSAFQDDGATGDFDAIDVDGDGATTVGDFATFLWYFTGIEAPSSPDQPLLPGPPIGEIEIVDLVADGGWVYGNAVVLPAGATLTIDTRFTAPQALGVGLSYHGYDPALLSFVDGLAARDILSVVCLGSPGAGFGGLTNSGVGAMGATAFELVETGTRPTSLSDPGGAPRVQVFRALSVAPAGSHPTDPQPVPGIDGVCGNGDAEFRVRFEAVADGFTEVEIGTGADLGDVIVDVDASDPMPPLSSPTRNARVRIAAPEPGSFAGVLAGLLGLATLARWRGTARRQA